MVCSEQCTWIHRGQDWYGSSWSPGGCARPSYKISRTCTAIQDPAFVLHACDLMFIASSAAEQDIRPLMDVSLWSQLDAGPVCEPHQGHATVRFCSTCSSLECALLVLIQVLFQHLIVHRWHLEGHVLLGVARVVLTSSLELCSKGQEPCTQTGCGSCRLMQDIFRLLSVISILSGRPELIANPMYWRCSVSA